MLCRTARECYGARLMRSKVDPHSLAGAMSGKVSTRSGWTSRIRKELAMPAFYDCTFLSYCHSK